LWNENDPFRPVDALLILHVDKETGGFRELVVDDPADVRVGWETFLLLRRLHDLDKHLKKIVNGNGKPKKQPRIFMAHSEQATQAE
jgi:hypothetical protein